MILRYFNTDYTTYKEDEILFRGTVPECYKYLMKNWSIDCKEITDLSLQSEFIHNLNCIKWCYENKDYPFMPKDFQDSHSWSEEDWELKPHEIANSAWKELNIQVFIFNRNLV